VILDVGNVPRLFDRYSPATPMPALFDVYDHY